MGIVKRKPVGLEDAARLLRELRESVQKSDSELVGKAVDEVVESTRRVREQLWRERLSESSSTPTSSSSP